MNFGRLSRLGVFALLTGGAIVTAVACSDDDKAAAPGAVDSGTDAQADTGVTPPPADAAADAATPAQPRVVVNLVHALSDLESIQICLGVGNSFPAPDPIPPTGGIAPGVGAALPIPDAFVSILANLPANTYVFPAGLATVGATCADIVGGTGGVPAEKVFKLNPIQPGTFKLDHSHVILLLGCQAENETGEAVCGAGYDGGSSLRTEVIDLDPNAAGNDKIGFQFVHASPQAQSFFAGAFGETQVQAQIAEGDAAATNIGSPIGFTSPVTATPGTAVGSMTALSSPATNGVQFVASDGGAFPAPVFVNFDAISLMTTGSDDAGAYFAKDRNYAIVAIGNPGVDPADPHGFRLIALRSSLLK